MRFCDIVHLLQYRYWRINIVVHYIVMNIQVVPKYVIIKNSRKIKMVYQGRFVITYLKKFSNYMYSVIFNLSLCTKQSLYFHISVYRLWADRNRSIGIHQTERLHWLLWWSQCSSSHHSALTVWLYYICCGCYRMHGSFQREPMSSFRGRFANDLLLCHQHSAI